MSQHSPVNNKTGNAIDAGHVSQTSAREDSDAKISRTSAEKPPQTPESEKSKKSEFGTPSSTVSPTGAVKGSPVTDLSAALNTTGHGGTMQTGTEVLVGIGTSFGGTQAMYPSMGELNDHAARPAKRLRRFRAQSDPSPSPDSTSDDGKSDNSNEERDTTQSYDKRMKPNNGKDK